MAIDPSERGPRRRYPGDTTGQPGLLWCSMRVLISAMISAAAVGLWQGYEARRTLYELADSWDHQYDTLILSNGTLSATGPRLPRYVEGGELIFDLYNLREPSDMPFEPNVVVFQTEALMMRQNGLVKVMPYADMQRAFGVPDLQVNSDSMRKAIDDWGTRIMLGIVATSAVVWSLSKASLAGLVTLAAAAMLTVGLGRQSGERFGGWARQGWRLAWALPPTLAILAIVGAQVSTPIALVVMAPPLAAAAWLTRGL